MPVLTMYCIQQFGSALPLKRSQRVEGGLPSCEIV